MKRHFATTVALALLIPASGQACAGTAYDLLQTFGLNIHIQQGVNELWYRPIFNFTGIRYARDGGASPTAQIAMYQNTGVKFQVLAWCPNANFISQTMQMNAAGALAAVEGPNEPNNIPDGFVCNGVVTHSHVSWGPFAAAQWYLIQNAHSQLPGIPVVGTSETGAQPDNWGEQYLQIPSPIPAGVMLPAGMNAGDSYADDANVHNYVCDHSAIIGENQAWNAAKIQGGPGWDDAYSNYTNTWLKHFPGMPLDQITAAPRMITETGYATGEINDHCTVTPTQQAKTILNLLLDNYVFGWTRTFIYEARDEGGNFGIYYYDGTPKVAATALHNLTTILADHEFTPGTPPTYSLGTPPPTVHSTLLAKSDGSWFLAIWDEHLDGSGKKDNVTVTFDQPRTISVFDPMVGVRAGKTFSGPTANLVLSDHPLIVHIQ